MVTQSVIAFLSERRMFVRYKGKTSTIKSKINDAGFHGQVNNVGELATSKRNVKAVNQIHLKYVYDMSVAESVNLKENLVTDPDR